MGQPIGLQINNPLNIRNSRSEWIGQVGEDGGFVRFETMAHGIRAAAILLQTYAERYGIRTLEGIVSRWAPHEENPTLAYIANVAAWTGYAADDVLNPRDFATTKKLLSAMARQELGATYAQSITDETWEKGLRLAGLVPAKPLARSRTTVGAGVAGGATLSALLTDHFPELLPLVPYITDNVPPDLLLHVTAILGAAVAIYARYDDKRNGRL